jgi:hypothetical protein
MRLQPDVDQVGEVALPDPNVAGQRADDGQLPMSDRT